MCFHNRISTFVKHIFANIANKLYILQILLLIYIVMHNCDLSCSKVPRSMGPWDHGHGFKNRRLSRKEPEESTPGKFGKLEAQK